MIVSRLTPVLVGLLSMAPVSIFAADKAHHVRSHTSNPVVTAAGRNLRYSKSKSCRITLSPTHKVSQPGPAQVVVMLPKGARLLSAKVLRPDKTLSSCSTRRREVGSGIVRCTLNRLSGHQPVTVIARFHQLSHRPVNCSGYLTKRMY